MTTSIRNFSPSSERNQQVIFEKMKPLFCKVNSVLEIGSGSGQHAFYFQKQLETFDCEPLIWQCADRQDYLNDLRLNIIDIDNECILSPIELDVDNIWPEQQYDLIFTANSLHIMSEFNVENMFKSLTSVLEPKGYFCCYGPFKYNGQFTSDSNANFETWLKNRDEKSGIKDFEFIEMLATSQGLELVEDIVMPANNQLLIWQRV